MTADNVSLILHRLDEQHEDIREMKEQHGRELAEIKQQVQKTNGRVTELELWRARLEGVKIAIGWLPATLVTIAASTVTGVLVFVFTH